MVPVGTADLIGRGHGGPALSDNHFRIGRGQRQSIAYTFALEIYPVDLFRQLARENDGGDSQGGAARPTSLGALVQNTNAHRGV